MTTAIQFLSDSNAVMSPLEYQQHPAAEENSLAHPSQTKGQTGQSGPRKTQHLSIAENGHFKQA
jgi:hypothetical protein